MSIFGNLFGKNEEQQPQQEQSVQSAPMTTGALRTGNEVTLDLSKGGLLNLNKGDFLNLTKSGIFAYSHPCSRWLGHGKFRWKH